MLFCQVVIVLPGPVVPQNTQCFSPLIHIRGVFHTIHLYHTSRSGRTEKGTSRWLPVPNLGKTLKRHLNRTPNLVMYYGTGLEGPVPPSNTVSLLVWAAILVGGNWFYKGILKPVTYQLQVHAVMCTSLHWGDDHSASVNYEAECHNLLVLWQVCNRISNSSTPSHWKSVSNEGLNYLLKYVKHSNEGPYICVCMYAKLVSLRA
jgi:hypothetical protein